MTYFEVLTDKHSIQTSLLCFGVVFLYGLKTKKDVRKTILTGVLLAAVAALTVSYFNYNEYKINYVSCFTDGKQNPHTIYVSGKCFLENDTTTR